MADPRLFRLRVVFCKQGRLALLSHLEVARALERTVRRAGLPYAVTQGFSPHMRIAFGAALPVGVGGSHEFFDVLLERYVAPEAALEALQGASAADLMCKSCSYIESRAAAASVAFPVSTYRAQVSCAPADLVVPREIGVVRKKKSKVLDVADFLVGEVELAGSVVTFKLMAHATGSLRPDLFMSAVVDATNAAIAAGARSGDGALCVVSNESFAPGAAVGADADAPACSIDRPLHIVSITRIAQETAHGVELR